MFKLTVWEETNELYFTDAWLDRQGKVVYFFEHQEEHETQGEAMEAARQYLRRGYAKATITGVTNA